MNILFMKGGYFEEFKYKWCLSYLTLVLFLLAWQALLVLDYSFSS